MSQVIDIYYSPSLYLSAHRMRFLLSVTDEYEFICPAPVIWYDPVTYLPAFLIDQLHMEYRADFLIRNRETGVCFLVDLFPCSMQEDARLFLRRQIAENYILWKGYDWQYRCLFQEFIVLSPNEELLFASYVKMKTDGDKKQWLMNYIAMVNLLKPSVFQSPDYSALDYLIHSILPTS